jgi:hypothetical protein
MKIREFYCTFGVQYGRRPDDDVHPLGMFADGYAVIEAPNIEIARRMAGAIFEQAWAFVYNEKPKDRHAPKGELLRIAWMENGNERQPF